MAIAIRGFKSFYNLINLGKYADNAQTLGATKNFGFNFGLPSFTFSQPRYNFNTNFLNNTTFSLPTFNAASYKPMWGSFGLQTPYSFGAITGSSRFLSYSAFTPSFSLRMPRLFNATYARPSGKSMGLKFKYKNPFASKNTEDYSTAINFRKMNKSNLPKLQISNERLTQMGFNTASKREGWNSLKPEMQRSLVKLTEYAESKGIKIGYNSKRSIFRTYQEQAQIYKTARKGYAARPGHSRHESGEAVDINILSGNKEGARKILGQYWEKMGYTWGGRWRHTETWHFDLRPKRA